MAPGLHRVGRRLAAAGVRPVTLTAAGWAVGVGACVAVALGLWPLALALWLGNRLLDGLDGAVARAIGPTDRGGFLDIVADFSIYAGFVVGLAIAVRPPAGLRGAAQRLLRLRDRLPRAVVAAGAAPAPARGRALVAVLRRPRRRHRDRRRLRAVDAAARAHRADRLALRRSGGRHGAAAGPVGCARAAAARGRLRARSVRHRPPSRRRSTEPENPCPATTLANVPAGSRRSRSPLSPCSPPAGGGRAEPQATPDASDWDAVLGAAHGQTVNWYMYGGDDTLNAFITGYLADRLKPAGITINQVKITDTVDAVNKVLGREAERARLRRVGRPDLGQRRELRDGAAGWAVALRLRPRPAEREVRRLRRPDGVERLRGPGQGMRVGVAAGRTPRSSTTAPPWERTTSGRSTRCSRGRVPTRAASPTRRCRTSPGRWPSARSSTTPLEASTGSTRPAGRRPSARPPSVCGLAWTRSSRPSGDPDAPTRAARRTSRSSTPVVRSMPSSRTGRVPSLSRWRSASTR